MKKTIVINYVNMTVGGIENYIISLIKVSKSVGNRIIWLYSPKRNIDPVYKAVVNDEYVEKCELITNGFHWFEHGKLNFSKDELVVVLSFSVYDFLRVQSLKREFDNIKITTFMVIPHFTGNDIYPGQNYSILYSIMKKYFRRLYQEWINEGFVFYFSQKHITALEDEYNIIVPQEKRRLIPVMNSILDFDESKVIDRYLSDEFKIVSAGRLEFPHKGFVMGMIDVFVELKRKYPSLVYYIIGAGEGEKLLKKKIDSLPVDISNSIYLKKPMELDKLLSFYTECNLNISAAGCATYGAKVGLLTLPVRHYTYECEVYGFLPESKPYLLETKPGEKVQPYIEQVINMSMEQYLDYSKKSYDSYEKKEIDPDAWFKFDSINSIYQVRNRDIKVSKFFCYIEKILSLLKRIKKNRKMRMDNK